MSEADVDYRVVLNKKNSGSVLKQWAKGAQLTSGDLIWIAEADDTSEDNFLATVVTGFDSPNVVLSYSESKQIDDNGNVIGINYRKYTEVG